MLKLNQTSNDFGPVEINKASAPFVFTLSNAGSGTTGTPAISIQGGDFQISPASTCGALNAGATCMISVVFKPSSVGSKNGTLTVNATPGGAVTASLSGTGAMPGLNLNPSSHDFGAVAIGSMSDSFPITIQNTGMTVIGGLSVNVNGMDFVKVAADDKCATMMMLNAGQSCTIGVQFKPTAKGMRSGTVIASGGGQTVTGVLTGTGQTPAQLAINPASAMLAGQIGKEGPAQVFTVANTGDVSTGQVMATLGGANADQFKISANTCLAPLTTTTPSCQISVVSNASGMMGARTATLTVTSTPGGMAMATLTSNPVPPSALTITPNAADFMTVNVGSTSAATAFEVKNTGGTPTSTLSVTPSTVDFLVTANTCGGSMLAANATCAISVAFKPGSPGAKSAVLTVSGSAGESVQAALMGTGVSVGLSVDPAAPNFGSVATGSMSAPTTITVTNTGGNASGAVMASLAGTSASQWTISGNNCNGSLAPMATCMVTLVFAPTTIGDKTAQLVVTSAGGGTATAQLAGSGIAANLLQLSPANPFPTDATVFTNGTVIGTTSPAVTITVLNPAGGSPTGKLTFSLTNVAAMEYTITGTNCPEAGLAAGNSCTVTLTFSPQASGNRNASLLVNGAASNASTGSLQLSAVGRAPIEITPTSWDFGSTSVGVMATPKSFNVALRAKFTTVTPSVTTNFTAGTTLGGGGNCAAANTANISATDSSTWANCNDSVNFFPADRTPPAKTGTFTVTGTGGTMATASLTGTALGPLQVTPNPRDFGTVIVSVATTKTVTVHNNGAGGGAAFSPISVTIGGPNAGEFTLSGNGCVAAPLAAGTTCDLQVTLNATTAGAKAATLTVNATLMGSAQVETQTIDLTGTAGTPTPITVMPTMLTFTAPLLSTSAPQMVTITNPMNAAGNVTISKITTGPFAVTTNNCTMALVPGATCTMSVVFQPVGTVTGAKTGKLTVTGGAGNNADVALSGTALAAFSINPTSQPFGAVLVGDITSPTHDFVVTNNGGSDATALMTNIGASTAADSHPADYTVFNNTCTGTLAAGATCTVTVRMVPEDITLPITSSAVLTVSGTEAATAVTTSANLSGSRIHDAKIVFQNVAAGGETQELGKVRVGGMSSNFSATVVNTGEAATGALTPTLGGADAAHFAIVAGSTTCGAALAPAATCVVTVIYKPTDATLAMRTANITVSAAGHGGTTQAITLNATSVAAASLYVTPSPADLGAAVQGGTLPAAVTFTVTNATPVVTPANLTITPSDPASFVLSADTCSGMTLNTGANCTFKLQFTPQDATPGFVRGKVDITSGGLTATAGLFGRKQVDATFSITPATDMTNRFDFGTVLFNGTSADQTFTVKNIGERATGPIMLALAGAAPGEFAIGTSTCTGATLMPLSANSCTAVVHFHPVDTTTFGSKKAQVDITATPGITNHIFVTGTSALPTQLTLAPHAGSMTNYGNSPLGKAVTMTFDVTNRANGQPTTVGPSLSNMVDFTISDENCSTQPGGQLAGGATCSIDVTFAPTTVGATALVSTLSVSSSGGGAPPGLVLQGVGVSALSAALKAGSTLPLNTGGNTSATITISNAAGASNSGLLSTSVTGTDASLFQIMTNGCTMAGALAAGDHCDITVVFVAGSSATGNKTATLTVSGVVAGNAGSIDMTATNP
jgi:hypothetical protein